MNVGDTIQLVLTILTLLSIVAALVVAWWQLRTNRSESHKQRVSEMGVQFETAIASTKADLLPYWKDDESRRRYGDVNREIEVHRGVEQTRGYMLMLNSFIDESPSKRKQTRDLKIATEVLSQSLMVQYLALIPEDHDELNIKGEFTESPGMSESARLKALSIYRQVDTEKLDKASVADSLLNLSENFFSKCIALYLSK